MEGTASHREFACPFLSVESCLQGFPLDRLESRLEVPLTRGPDGGTVFENWKHESRVESTKGMVRHGSSCSGNKSSLSIHLFMDVVDVRPEGWVPVETNTRKPPPSIGFLMDVVDVRPEGWAPVEMNIATLSGLHFRDIPRYTVLLRSRNILYSTDHSEILRESKLQDLPILNGANGAKKHGRLHRKMCD